MRLVVFSVVFSGAACMALANDAPSFDCTKADSDAETLICEDSALAVLDNRLADRFAQALSAAEALQANAEEETANLRAVQRGWIKGRNECWKAQDMRDCVEFAYLSRENELVTQWMLMPSSDPVFWICENNQANEIVTMAFATELPSIRIEYGDTVATGSRSPSASGVKYVADFGRELWIKGDEALVTWSEGQTQSCKQRP